MQLNELENLKEEYLKDNDNRSDFEAALRDRDLNLLKRVSFFWAKAKSLSEQDSSHFSLYLVSQAQKSL